MKMIDYPSAEVQNAVLVGTGNSKGLLSTDLQGGYPTAEKSGKSLSTLFSGASHVNHLFIESIYNASGYFEFDSCQNFATLKNEDGSLSSSFTVYKELGTTDITERTTLKHGQFFPYNTITAGVYSEKNPENIYSASAIPGENNIGVLPETDPRKYEKLHTVGDDPNYYNGMEMSASFVQTPSGKDSWGHDIIFEFRGDDDFWLYVDDELIIDLGGIHSALYGRVNFATGAVDLDNSSTNLRALFRSNYKKRNPNASDAEVNDYLARYFSGNELIFKDYSAHTMKIFYMERGAGASNLHMRFNLSYITPGHVALTKKVTGSDDMDFNLVEYPYQIWYKDEAEGEEHLLHSDDEHINVTYQNSTQHVSYVESYTPPNSTRSYESVYFLNPGRTAEIHFPANTIEYKVIECGVNTEVYDRVTVNGDEITGESIGNSHRMMFDSGWLKGSERPTVVFENHVQADALRTLSIQKKLYDEQGRELSAENDPTTFSYRLYLSNGSDDVLKLANMYKYYVRDPQGYLCKWDADAQKFVSVGESDIKNIPLENRAEITFETSMNGAISLIPAWYTVAVPGLPVGTKFSVVERANEIPLGYRLLGYEREGETYLPENESTPNTGWVRANESPKMYVSNQRGWELEVSKIWSDSDYVTSHAPIYTAVYVGGELLEGSVRQIAHPNTSARYFFDGLRNGRTLDDYEIREVEAVNPVVGADGAVSGYQSISPLSSGDSTVISSVPKDSDTPAEHSYTVSYGKGIAEQTAQGISGENIRSDTVTNTRSDGVVITLYDMKTKEPLAGGNFSLKQGNNTLGFFTSDKHGRITVLYDCKRGKDYTLTETAPPERYIGLPNPAVFSIAADGKPTVTGNDKIWAKGRGTTKASLSVIAYIDVYNKPFTLRARKISSRTGAPLSGAHFVLYRTVKVIGGMSKDFKPMTGFDDLVTGADASEQYEWSKNGETQPVMLRSGASFTLKDGERVTVTLPQHVVITLQEDNDDYTTTFRLGDEPEQRVNSMSFTLEGDQTVAVVNTKNMLIPTGLKLHSAWAAAVLLIALAGAVFLVMWRRKTGDSSMQ